jgi:hypothetical protein
VRFGIDSKLRPISTTASYSTASRIWSRSDTSDILLAVNGEQVCHVCRQNEIEETTFLSEREALTLALKDFGVGFPLLVHNILKRRISRCH